MTFGKPTLKVCFACDLPLRGMFLDADDKTHLAHVASVQAAVYMIFRPYFLPGVKTRYGRGTQGKINPSPKWAEYFEALNNPVKGIAITNISVKQREMKCSALNTHFIDRHNF